MRNWKTTATGIGALVTLVVSFINGEPLSFQDVATALAGLGLVAAKDYNVSGR